MSDYEERMDAADRVGQRIESMEATLDDVMAEIRDAVHAGSPTLAERLYAGIARDMTRAVPLAGADQDAGYLDHYREACRRGLALAVIAADVWARAMRPVTPADATPAWRDPMDPRPEPDPEPQGQQSAD